MAALGPRQARRLAILTEAGETARLGRAREWLDIVARHGDVAMDFIWRHKGALAASTVMAAFLANPGPFLSGAKELTGYAARAVARPLVEEWMRENRGPEAQLRQLLDVILEAVEEVPRLLRSLDRLVGDWSR